MVAVVRRLIGAICHEIVLGGGQPGGCTLPPAEQLRQEVLNEVLNEVIIRIESGGKEAAFVLCPSVIQNTTQSLA